MVGEMRDGKIAEGERVGSIQVAWVIEINVV